MSAVHPTSDLAAYALDALEETEASAVEAHLEVCAACQARLEEYREVAAALAQRLPPLSPSPELAQRILREAGGGAATPDGSVAPRRPRLVSVPSLLARLRRNLVTVAVAAAAVLALGWGLALQLQINSLSAANAQLAVRDAHYERVIDVLMAQRFEVRTLVPEVAADAWGRVYYDADSGQGMLMVDRLPPPPPGWVYQVWVVRAGERSSAALFRTGGDGRGYTLIQTDEPLGKYQSLGITLEPAPGSAAPTSPRLLGATF